MMKMYWGLSLCFLFAAIVFDSVAADCSLTGKDTSIWNHYSAKYSGEATYYGLYTNGGACSLDPISATITNGIQATVAIADNIWDGSKACGMCVNVTATGVGSGAAPLRGNYIVYVNNRCPSCTTSGIDFGLSGDGIWDITWKAIPCPIASDKIQFVFQGANSYYIKLQVRNTRYPVYAVALVQNGVDKPLKRTEDNFFLDAGTVTFPLVFPLTVKVTSSTGDVITDSIDSLTNGVVLAGKTQFLDCGPSTGTTSGSTTKAPTTTTTTTSTTKAPTTSTTSSTTKAPTTSTTSSTTKAPTTSTTSSTTKAPTTSTTKAPTTSTTSTTKAASTSGGSTTGSTSTTKTVYVDALASGWEYWGWSSNKNDAATTYARGTKSFSFALQKYEAIYFHSTSPITLTSTFKLQFYAYSTTRQEASALKTILYVSGTATGSTPAFPLAVPASAWTLISVPLSSYGLATSVNIDGFAIQSLFADASSTLLYVDDISIIL